MNRQKPHVLDQPVLDLLGRHSPNPGPVDNAGDELVVDNPIAVDYACGDGNGRRQIAADGHPLSVEMLPPEPGSRRPWPVLRSG